MKPRQTMNIDAAGDNEPVVYVCDKCSSRIMGFVSWRDEKHLCDRCRTTCHDCGRRANMLVVHKSGDYLCQRCVGWRIIEAWDEEE